VARNASREAGALHLAHEPRRRYASRSAPIAPQWRADRLPFTSHHANHSQLAFFLAVYCQFVRGVPTRLETATRDDQASNRIRARRFADVAQTDSCGFGGGSGRLSNSLSWSMRVSLFPLEKWRRGVSRTGSELSCDSLCPFGFELTCSTDYLASRIRYLFAYFNPSTSQIGAREYASALISTLRSDAPELASSISIVDADREVNVHSDIGDRALVVRTAKGDRLRDRVGDPVIPRGLANGEMQEGTMGTASGRARPGTDWQRCARLPG
jgi:hypothetical protein